MTGKKGNSLRVLTNLLAFVAIILITVSLILAKVNIAPNISHIMEKIASIIAYSLVGLSSFWFAMSKRSITIKLVWFVCCVAIILMLVL